MHLTKNELFDRLNVILDDDPKMDELGLVVSACSSEFGLEPSGIDSPFFHHDHKLGIAIWAITPIMERALEVFRSTKCSLQLAQATRVMVLINADHYSVWNRRRQMVLDGHLSPSYDLQLLRLIFSKYPKSGESWAYRRWLLSLPSTEFNESLICSEMALCDRVADIYPRNYYAWSHRRWICNQFPSGLHNRFSESQSWINMHISDYSAFHHRLTLIDDRLRQDKTSFIESEFDLIHDLCIKYPGHESFWIYLRAMWSLIIIRMAKFSFQKQFEFERTFVNYCLDQDDATNYRIQRACAASYLCSLLLRDPIWSPDRTCDIIQLCKQLEMWSPHQAKLWQKISLLGIKKNKP